MSWVRAKSACQSSVQWSSMKMPPTPAGRPPMGDEEVFVGPGLEPGIMVGAVRVEMGLLRGVKMSRILCVFEAGFQVGATPEPPCARRQNIRVFMWTAGTCGFCMCATSEMPEPRTRIAVHARNAAAAIAFCARAPSVP